MRARFALQGQMVVAHVAGALELPIGVLVGLPVLEEADLPQLFAMQFIERVAEQRADIGVSVDNAASVGIQDQDPVLGGLKQAPITVLGALQRGLGTLAFGYACL